MRNSLEQFSQLSKTLLFALSLIFTVKNEIILLDSQQQLYIKESQWINQEKFIGILFNYSPLAQIPQIGTVTREQSTSYLLIMGKDYSNNQLLFIHYVSFDFNLQTITHTIEIKTISQIIQTSFILNPLQYEGIWFIHYIYFNSNQLIIGLRSNNFLEEQQFQVDQFQTEKFQLIVGGSLDTQDSNFNKNYYLSSYPGYLRPIFEESINDIQTILNQINIQTCIATEDNLQIQQFIFSQTSYQQIQLNQQQSQSYQLSFWIKVIINDDDLTKLIYLVRISGNNLDNYNDQIGGNIFVLSYINQDDQWYYNIEYYIYNFPYFYQTQDYIEIKKYQDQISESYIQNWHYIIINYQNYCLKFYSFNLLLNKEININFFNVYQFSNIKSQIYIGGNEYEITTQNGTIVDVLFFNCLDSLPQTYCHYTCKSCNGPYRHQCTSCEESTGRILNNNNICQCQLWLVDDGTILCKDSKYYDSELQIIYLDENENYDYKQPKLICSFGYFKYEDECFQCPSGSQEGTIICLECLQNPETWIDEGTCSNYYIQDYGGSVYQLEFYAEVDQFYFFNQQLYLFNQINMCSTNQDECIQYEIEGASQTIYFTCDQTTQFDEGLCQYVIQRPGRIGVSKCYDYCGFCSYGTCYYCQDQPNYFMSWYQDACIPCNIKHCKYCFQYNQLNKNQVTAQLFTIYGDYSQDQEDYILACAQCQDGYIFDFSILQCILNNFQLPCLNGYIDENQISICTSLDSDDFDGKIIEIGGCQQFISYCERCVQDSQELIQCVQCQDGYYLNVLTYICQPCSNEFDDKVTKCQMTKPYQDNWKLDVMSFFFNFQPDQFKLSLAGQSYQQQYFALECIDGYATTENSCLKLCDDSCQNCSISGSQNYCLSCNTDFSEMPILSYINKKCQTCPYPCQMCIYRTIDQIQQINPYYTQTDESTYQCLLNNQNKLTFIEMPSYIMRAKDINNNQKYLTILKKSDITFSNQEYYVSQEYITRMKASVYIDQYNQNRQDIPISLRENIFSLTNSTLLYNTNFQIDNRKLQFINYTQVILQNLSITSNNFNTTIDSNYGVNIILQNINININTQQYNILQNSFMLYHVNNLSILNFTIYDTEIINNFILINSLYKEDQISLNFYNITFINCIFKNSAIINISLTSIIIKSIIFKNIQFINCKFTNSYFLQNENSQLVTTTVQLQNISIINCNFSNASLFDISTFQNIKFQDFQITNSIFLNSIIIKLTQTAIFNNFYLNSIQLISTYLLHISDLNITEQQTNQTFNSLTMINIQFDQINPVYIYHSDTNKGLILFNQMQIINVTSIEIDIQQTISIDNSKCLFFLYGYQVVLQNLNNLKSLTFWDFCFYNFYYLSIYNYNVTQEYNQIDLNNLINSDISNNVNYGVFYIQEYISIEINQFIIENQIQIDQPIITIQSKGNYQQTQNIIFSNIYLTNNKLLKTSINSYATILYIHSDYYCQVQMEQIYYQNNIIFHQIQDFSVFSPGLLSIDVYQSQILLTDFSFINNNILNTSDSLIYLTSSNIMINNFNVTNVNYYNDESIIEIDNSYIKSIGGIAYISSENILIMNGVISSIQARQGSAFYLKTTNLGQINITYLNLFNIETSNYDNDGNSKGGSLYIDASGSQLQLIIINSLISNSKSVDEGGFLYLIPSQEQNIIKLSNIIFQNVLSLDYSIFQLSFPQLSSNNLVIMKNISIIISQDQSLLFFQYTDDNYNSNSNGMIQVTNSLIIIDQFYFSGIAIQPILNLQFYEKIYLNTFYLSNINMNSSYLVYVTNYINGSINLIDLQSIIQTSNFNLINIQNNNNQTIGIIFIEIKQFSDNQENFQLLFNEYHFINIQCNDGCSQGMFNILINQWIKQIKLQNQYFFNNICGTNSCFVLSKNLFIDNDNTNFVIKEIYFNNNTGTQGGCLNIQQQNINMQNGYFINNSALQKGGALYMNISYNQQKQFENIYIINNEALIGGGIYLIDSMMNPIFYDNILLLNNNGINYINNIREQPSKIALSIFGEQIDSLSYNNGSFTQESSNLIKYQIKNDRIYLPSGQEIGQYQIFNKSNLEYIYYNIQLNIIVINSLLEKQINQQDSQCQINTMNNNVNQTISTLLFNETLQAYDLSQQKLVFDPYDDDNYNIKFEVTCNNIYWNNYSFYFNAQFFQCQMGEQYYYNQCLTCDYNKGFYAVQEKALECKKLDPQAIKQNTANLIELYSGYWRPSYNNPHYQYCQKEAQACQGGWNVGDESCNVGSIGALCEECDIYNIRGQGKYYKTSSQQCNECGNYISRIITTFFITILTLFSIFLTVRSVLTIFQTFKRLKIATKHYQIIFRKSLDQSAALIKMIVNYFQILVGIKSFQLTMYFNILDWLLPLSNPIGSSTYSFDCFFSLQEDIQIVYISLLTNLLIPILYFTLFIMIYLIFVYRKKARLAATIYVTALLYMFFYAQPNIIKELGALISQRNISDISWINKNVSYKYFTTQHLNWIYIAIIPLLIITGITIPFCLFFLLHLKRTLFNQEKVRSIWGYIYNDYKEKSYYWEIVRIIQREIIILSLALNEENIIIKGAILFFILLCYYTGISIIYPYNMESLNKFEQKSIFLCGFIVIICCLKYEIQTQNYIYIDLPLQGIIIMLLIYFFYQLLKKVIQVYYDKYTERLDPLRRLILKKIPNILKYCPSLRRLLKIKQDQLIRIKKNVTFIRTQLKMQKNEEKIQQSIIQKSAQTIDIKKVLMHDSNKSLFSDLQKSIYNSDIQKSLIHEGQQQSIIALSVQTYLKDENKSKSEIPDELY